MCLFDQGQQLLELYLCLRENKLVVTRDVVLSTFVIEIMKY